MKHVVVKVENQCMNKNEIFIYKSKWILSMKFIQNILCDSLQVKSFDHDIQFEITTQTLHSREAIVAAANIHKHLNVCDDQKQP